MKRLLLCVGVLAVTACGRPSEDPPPVPPEAPMPTIPTKSPPPAVPAAARPAIDLEMPEKIETATFALG